MLDTTRALRDVICHSLRTLGHIVSGGETNADICVVDGVALTYEEAKALASGIVTFAKLARHGHYAPAVCGSEGRRLHSRIGTV